MSVDSAVLPTNPATGEPLQPTHQPGYYPGFSTLSQSPFWEDATRDVVEARVSDPPKRRFFTEEQWAFWTLVFSHLIPQTDRTEDRQIPLIPPLDERLYLDKTVGYRYEDMPTDQEAYRLGIAAIDAEAQHQSGGSFTVLPYHQRELVLQTIAENRAEGARDIWKCMSQKRFWQLIMQDATENYYSHPWAWDEIGFGGPAYPRAYMRLERGEPEPWEKEECRYDWADPALAVSGKVDPSGSDDQSHHGSGGTH
jgi:hypothetical protein